MRTWQIFTASGLHLGNVESVTATGALNKLAQEKGFESWQKWNECLNLISDFTVYDTWNRIVIGE